MKEKEVGAMNLREQRGCVGGLEEGKEKRKMIYFNF